jgi:hypothetical protein
MWAAALAVTAASALSARADAAIYWTDNFVHPVSHEVRGHIGRANLNGKHVKPRFITLKRKVIPWGLAANRRHIFWTAASAPPVGIGRANLDGSGVDQGFTPVLPVDDEPGAPAGAHSGIAVAGGHIYWVNPGRGTIGRSDLDGSNVNSMFITNPPDSSPSAIAVGGGYVFWGNQDTIGRANLDGSDPNPAFIVGARFVDSIVVARGHVYWGNTPPNGENTVGRAKTDGTEVNHLFLRRRTALSLAARGRYIYGSDFDHIWRARLDGSQLKRHFIKVKAGSHGIAVR